MKKSVLYIGNYLKQPSSNPTYMQALGSFLQGEGCKVVFASSKRNQILRFLDMLWTCYEYRNQVDLVLIDTYSTLNFYYAFAVSQLCKLLGLPYIPILHGGNLEARLKKNPRLSKMLFKHAQHLVSPSQFMLRVFEHYGYSNLVFIPNSLNLEDYAFQLRKLEPPVKLLWVRSFSKIYNPTLAVTVLKRLLDEGIPAELCMVGPDADGSLETTKALAKELGVEVTFTGKLSKTDWIALSQDYSVFINTTHFDNMPVSVIEAMALGLPVVSTRVGGMPYLIEHEKDGLLVPPNTAEAFVVAIKRLLATPDLGKTIALNARVKVEQFDWTHVKWQWKQLLNTR